MKPGLLTKAHERLIECAHNAKGGLLRSIDAGYRGPEERAKQIEHLLDYQEYLLAADVVAGYEKSDA